jgi:heavy metal efflux system protein
MFARIIELSIRLRRAMAVLLLLVLAGGVVAARSLPIDAVPDVTTAQVSVLTEGQGLSPTEVERSITAPIEMALNGTPRLVELRSVSRTGLSAVTVIFEEGTDIWFARQVVLERIRGAESELPAGAGRPELSPVSGGLGEIYQFVVRSDHHSPMQLRTMLDWEIVPRLRSVPGVIEVNTMGGDLKEFQVVVDRGRLHAHEMTLGDVATAIEKANATVGGGYIERGAESLGIRGVGALKNEDEIANVVLRTAPDGTPVLVKHIGQVRVGAALRYGVTTHDGEGEAVTGTVMMLVGANSRDVVAAVKARVDEIKADLPAGVVVEPIYDRSDFVGRTLHTVMGNLLEGALVVFAVLTLLLGSVRGALVVVVGIPASMTIALFGMHLAGVTGDLMSFGAIDFGFLVDGPIVLLEALVATMAGKAFASAGARAVLTTGAVAAFGFVPMAIATGAGAEVQRPLATVVVTGIAVSSLLTLFLLPGVLRMALGSRAVPLSAPEGLPRADALTARRP